MTAAAIDVVVPVWNRPNETRNCLVSLINYTPSCRLIMYDCGSDRDTERLLQELADSLDDRALLMRDDSNIGFVRAANRGLESSEAPLVALLRNTTQVSAGWLEPLLSFASAHPEAGILVPSLSPAEAACRRATEIEHPCFGAMVLSRALYREIGGLDEGLDGGVWCLRDYARRACSRGFLTYRVPGPPVACFEEARLGSERRRQENLQLTLRLFRERWGEGRSYVVHVPKGVDLELLGQKLDWLVKGARVGGSFSVLLPAPLFKAAQQAGLDLLHEKVRLVPLPRLKLGAARRRAFEREAARDSGTVAVAAIDGIPFPWGDAYLSFSELTETIREGGL